MKEIMKWWKTHTYEMNEEEALLIVQDLKIAAVRCEDYELAHRARKLEGYLLRRIEWSNQILEQSKLESNPRKN